MNYRHLGHSGLKVSELTFGSWVTFGNQMGEDLACECMATAYGAGVNFFDNAEVYARGQSEAVMGNALKKLAWRRGSYLVSTKFFWGLHDGPNEKNTLNRKRLLDAMDGSLKRLQLDYVDLIFCHRPDATTPIEETVWAMHDIVSRGKAVYWGTSEWSAAEIMEAWQIADKHHLHKPVRGTGHGRLARHLSVGKHRDLLAKAGHLLELVRHKDDGLALLRQPAKDRKELRPLLGGDHCRRLVEDQDTHTQPEETGDFELLALPDAQIEDGGVGVELKVKLLEEHEEPVPDRVAVERPPAGGTEEKVIEHR